MTTRKNNSLNYKNNRNNTQKMVKEAKKQYTTNKINNSHNKWRTIKNINNVNQQHPPNKILFNNNNCLSIFLVRFEGYTSHLWCDSKSCCWWWLVPNCTESHTP